MPVLEAQLAIMGACALAFEVFFQRYFKVSSSRSNCHATNNHDTAMAPSPCHRSHSHSFSTNNASQHSTICSRIEDDGTHNCGVPFHGLKISQDMIFCVQNRDNVSRKSDESTKKSEIDFFAGRGDQVGE